MTTTDVTMMAETNHELLDWRRNETMNLKSGKAERILGVATLPDDIKPKRRPLNFSLADLRIALPGISRKASRSRINLKNSDSDSVESTTSPIFEPCASRTSLNTTTSSPTAAKYYQTNNDSLETLSQAETLRSKKVYMPTTKDMEEFKYLPKLDLPSLAPLPQQPRRKRSIASFVSFGSDAMNKTSRYNFKSTNVSREQLLEEDVLPELMPIPSAEQHVKNWLESAEFDRRPTSSTRLPVPTDLSSSGASIQTLTSEPSASETTSTQWPLPRTMLSPPRKIRRIHKSNLQLESVLSFSSDEEDSDSSSPPYIRRKSSLRRSGRPSFTTTHTRTESSVSSIINLDTRSYAKPSLQKSRSFPKRSLADIAASASGHSHSRGNSAQSWETDAIAEIDGRSISTMDINAADDVVVLPTAIPLWRSSSGSFDVDIRISRGRVSLQPLPEHHALDLGEEDLDDALSNFPVPPRSRAGSIVPTIRVQYSDGVDEGGEYPVHDGVLLSPSVMSRCPSVGSGISEGSSRSCSSLIAAQQGFDFEGGKEIEEVIYVSGLETSALPGLVGEEDDVRGFVWGSVF